MENNKVVCNFCGEKLNDGSKFCPKCGAQIDGESSTIRIAIEQEKSVSVESLIAYTCGGTAITMIISAFLNLFKMDFGYEYISVVDTSFSPFEFSKTIRRMIKLLEVGENNEDKLLFLSGIFFFYCIAFALAAILLVLCLKMLTNTKGKIRKKYYKDVKSSLLFSIGGNVGVWLILQFANQVIEDEIDMYLFKGTTSFFVTLVIGIIGVVLASNGIRKCNDDTEKGTVETFVENIKNLKKES